MSLVADQISGSDPYERTMARALATRDRLAADIDRIKTIGVTEFPADWLPWLVIHYGLEEIAPYVGDLLRTLVEGRPWQRVRGTPAATEDFVLGWLGLAGLDVPDGHGGSGPVEEEPVHDAKWWLYQIALTGPIDLPLARRLADADLLSRNAGTSLGRIYGGYDVRAARLDGTKFDDCLWDDWSGAFVPGHAPKLSFGAWHGGSVSFEAGVVALGYVAVAATVAVFGGAAIWDRSRLDDEVMEPGVVGIATSFASETSDAVRRLAPWPLRLWPRVPWGDVEFECFGGPDAGGLPPLPDGKVFYVDLEGRYLVDLDGRYLIGDADA